jgi:uncharacterized heparinase superfamily protein
MSRVSIAERINLSLFLARGMLRKLVSRATAIPLGRLPFVTGKADRLVISPQDLRTSDATRASEIYAGRFVFAGKVVVCDARSPFEVTPPSDDWAAALTGFGWLRHLRAAESGITRANARALVDEWITLQSRNDAIAWRPDVMARRIISWLTQATLVLDDSDVRFYRRFIRSLTRQVRHLRHMLSDARDGVPRLQASIALAYAALCMSGQARHIKAATKRLSEELTRQILPDGGHISRNPGALVELLVDLLPLRQVFSARNIPPPPALLNAIDRLMPMLRFFRHGDGNFALFNGMGPTPTDLLTTILAYDDARGAPVANAPHSGYQRIESGGTLVLMDTGRAPPLPVSQDAHAGCLAIELSSKFNRIVINCGLPATSRESWRQVARATAAHSTVTFNDVSSARFVDSGPIKRMLQGMPIVGGPQNIPVTREEQDGAVVLRASHDGYADDFGVVHERTLMLWNDGERLDGEDMFLPSQGDNVPTGRDAFALRFHLHPSVKTNRLTDSHGAMLMLPNKEVWTFNAYEDRIDLEESVYLAGPDGPRRTMQIVVYGRARKTPRVQWTFAHVPPGGASTGPRRDRAEEPQLPLG